MAWNFIVAYFLVYHQAHKINNGCKTIKRTHAISGVTVRLPNSKGALLIMLMCTGKNAISINMIPQAAYGLGFGNISKMPNNSSKQPASIFTSIGYGM